MNLELAESIKDLVKPANDALSVIVKSVEKECQNCEGRGWYRYGFPGYIKATCSRCNGTGEISQQEMIRQAKESIAKKERGRYQLVYKKDRRTIVAEPRRWTWVPKAGEYCLWGQAVLLITDVNDFILSVSGIKEICRVNVNQVVPILPWQEIKRVLEGMGYIVKVRDQKDFGKEYRYNCGIYTDKLGVGASAPTCQEATMLAVDRLAKELK